MAWMISNGEGETGPYSDADVASLLANGQANAATLVREDGSDDVKPLKNTRLQSLVPDRPDYLAMTILALLLPCAAIAIGVIRMFSASPVKRQTGLYAIAVSIVGALVWLAVIRIANA